MAIDEADGTDTGQRSETSVSESDDPGHAGPVRDSSVRVGAYTWADFMEEYGHGDEVSTLYPHGTEPTGDQLGLETDEAPAVPSGDDWETVSFDPEPYLGFHPDDLEGLITDVFAPNAKYLNDVFLDYVDPETTPVVKDVYTWEHYKWEYYYEEDGSRPRDAAGEIEPFDAEEALGFDPDDVEAKLSQAGDAAMALDDLVEERTVNVREDVDEDEFFSTEAGHTTVVNRYDLEKAVPLEKKSHFREEDRYWVNKPYSFVIIFHSEKENEKKYYAIEPYLNEIESELQEFLSGKLRTAIKYADEAVKHTGDEDAKATVIEVETRKLLNRYGLFEKPSRGDDAGLLERVTSLLDGGEDASEPEDDPSVDGADESDEVVDESVGDDAGDDADEPGFLEKLKGILNDEEGEETESADDEESIDDAAEPLGELDGIEVRPEPVILAEDPDRLNEYQVEKLLYMLKRDFIGYERIDPVKHDINVEDISCDGYNSPVFVYHSEYEQIISNIFHGKEELDDFVVKLAQRSGKGISKRLPQVDATLPDGSRAQLTLGPEVSDHGTNYTIRQFKDVPFTPVDLINWNTFSLEEMAFLWLCIENNKSLIFAGGTASGKTTSLNAVSLFIPSKAKIVSIEDTREVELPQRNWIASVTRPSFSDDAQGDVDEFDLLEAALRQRPDYIVMGEIRGEEGRTAFQVMSTGHTTYTTFHADSVDEVLKRFTTDPINVSKTMFTALDLVSIQTQTRVQGRKVRRNKSLTEINHYEAENDEINVQDVYQWQAETDEYLKMGDSNILDEIKFDRGWSHEKLQEELFKREAILAYLIKNGFNTYAQVAATVQAFINDPDTILTLIANGQLEESLEDLREMESVLIDVDPEKEALVPRPDATEETYNLSIDILERAEESLFDEYRGKVPGGLGSALGEVEEADTIEVDRADVDEFDFGGEVDDDVGEDEWQLGDGSAEFAFEAEPADEPPSWLDDDSGFDIGDADASTAAPDADADEPDRPQLEAAPSTANEAGTVDEAGGTPDEAATGSTDERPDESAAGGAEPASGESLDLGESPSGTGFGFEEDRDEDEVGGLFADMGSTLEELEQAESGAESPSSDDEGDDAAESQGDLDSLFLDDRSDRESDPEPGDATDASAEDEPSPGSERETIGDSMFDDSMFDESDADGEESDADTDADESDVDADADESDVDADADEPDAGSDDVGDVDTDDSDADGEESDVDGDDADGEESTFDEDGEANEPGAGEETEDEGSNGEESTSDAEERQSNDREDAPTSIFGEGPSSSIFTDESAADEAEDGGGSLFDAAGDSPFEPTEPEADDGDEEEGA